MIKVCVKKDKFIEGVTVSGHSGYDTEGHDIVCAGVSSIVTTTVNAILKLDKDALIYESKSGYVKMDIKKEDEVVNILMENMISLLKELEEKYKKYINVK